MESFLSESCGSRGGRCCGESAFQKEAPAPGKQPGGVSHRLGLCLPQPGGGAPAKPSSSGEGFGSTKPHRGEESSTCSCHGVEIPPAPSIGSASPGYHRFGGTVRVAAPCFAGSGVAHFSAGPGRSRTAGCSSRVAIAPHETLGKSFNASVPPTRRHYRGARQMDARGRGQESRLGAGSWIHTGSGLGLSGA